MLSVNDINISHPALATQGGLLVLGYVIKDNCFTGGIMVHKGEKVVFDCPVAGRRG